MSGVTNWVEDKASDVWGGITNNPLETVTTAMGMPGVGTAVDKATGGVLSSSPTAPDPMSTAKTQLELNKEIALWNAQQNRISQITPYGNMSYTRDPTTGEWTQTTTLSPGQQGLLGSSTNLQQGMLDGANNLIDQVRNNYSNPLDFSNLPQLDRGTYQYSVPTRQMQTSIQPYESIQNDLGDAGSIQNSLADAGNIQRYVDTSGINPLSYSANRGAIQNQIDMSGVPSLVGGQDLVNFQNQARDAAWNNAKASLDPQWDQYESRLEQKLANQGVTQNSDAWNRAVAEMSRERQYDYSQAQNNAVNQGLTAANQLYNQGLSSNQNAFSQALNRGNFTNSAQQQDFLQNYQNAQLGNQASMDMFGARRAVMSDANAAQQQQYNQNLASGEFGNTAQQQRYNQNLLGSQFHNDAQAQGFGQNQANAEFGNAANESMYNMDLRNATLNNTATSQNFNDSQAARNQGLNELMTQYREPLTALTSILSGSQPTMPQFSSYYQTNASEPNYANLVANNYASKVGQYNSTIGGLSGLGGTALTMLPFIL